MTDDQPKRPPPVRAPAPSPLSDQEVCQHIVEQCAELRRLTRRPRLRTVGYLLDMARVEAEKIARGEGA